MFIKVHRPVYEAKGEPLIEVWGRWGSFGTPPNGYPWFMRGAPGSTRWGGHLRLPLGYMLVVLGPVEARR